MVLDKIAARIVISITSKPPKPWYQFTKLYNVTFQKTSLVQNLFSGCDRTSIRLQSCLSFMYRVLRSCSCVFPWYSWLDTDPPPLFKATFINLATSPVVPGNLFQGKFTGNTDLKIF
jgi:hypothetical protein